MPKAQLSYLNANKKEKTLPNTLGNQRKRKRKSITRGHVKDIGSAGGIHSYGGRGTKGLWPGSAFVTSWYLHLYVMAVLSGARVVRALLVRVTAPC
jgi:hypothetical protein